MRLPGRPPSRRGKGEWGAQHTANLPALSANFRRAFCRIETGPENQLTGFDSLALRHLFMREVTMWKTLNEVKITDILQFVRDASRDGQAVHIGTDSLQSGRVTQFVTVVVILTPRKGGRVAYRRETVPRITSLRERLLKEVWRSVDLGLQFSPIVRGDLTVHIDANPVVAHKSSQHVQELVGLVVGQGFKALIKPESWAASHAADHVVRSRRKLPRDGVVVGWPSGRAHAASWPRRG